MYDEYMGNLFDRGSRQMQNPMQQPMPPMQQPMPPMQQPMPPMQQPMQPMQPPRPPRPPYPPYPPYPPQPPRPPKPQPPRPPRPTPPPPRPIPKVGDIYLYTVNHGDSLSSIARRFNTSVDLIRNLNDLNRNAMLYPGQRLLIPVLYEMGSPRIEEAREEPKQSYELYF